MKTFTIPMVVTGALVAGMLSIAAAKSPGAYGASLPQEGRACALHTLHGSYLFVASGFNIVGGVAQPKAIHEALEFNGDGTVTVTGVTLSVNGNISHPPAGSGGYTVETDCRGTLDFSNGPSFDIVVALDGATVWMFQTNPNTVFQGIATRLDR